MATGRTRTASFGLTFLGGVAVFCAFAVAAWILFAFTAPAPTYEQQRSANRLDKLAAIKKDAQDKLYSPAKWIDKTKGTVQLPIDTAMDLIVAEYQTKQVQPSQVKVDDPYPYGLQSPTAAAAAASPAPNAPATKGLASPSPAAASPAPAAPAATPNAAMQQMNGQPLISSETVVATKPVEVNSSPAASPEVKP